ncbi:MAG: hypothetical protein HQL17_03630 [Candidatus Omnitrophica bacterium]|nr:hypothetical protein [Candidatus Omnitrophota bacterium]
MRNFLFSGLIMLTVVVAGGCATGKGSEGPVILTAAQLSEPAWIRNGDGIPFEGEEWFPTDEVESILDTEVYQAGTYRDVQFYLEKTDVRPFDRVYTRFAKNRYRAFEQ